MLSEHPKTNHTAPASTSEEQFVLSVLDADLEFLREKLDIVRFPDELSNSGWDYGAPLADIKRLATYWRNGYDWRRSEAIINELPMFTRDIAIEGHGMLNIHYVHAKSAVADAIPLLFVHGWPGHFLEVRKLIPILTAQSPEHPSFHVVAVGLPGFGFSEAPTKPGFKGPQYAEVSNKLMLVLGYQEYVTQGGDWGHLLNLFAANIYGHKFVKAWHTNFPITNLNVPDWRTHPRVLWTLLTLPFNLANQKLLEYSRRFVTTGLADSPVGLLAWIYEKLVSWSDEYPWTDDEVLEWVSIYWFSRSGPGASLRIYHELSSGNTHDVFVGTEWSTLPLGTSHFPRELVTYPKSWARMLGRVIFQSEHEKGGHFAAFEELEALAGDLRKMFGKGGPAYGIVPGKKGYGTQQTPTSNITGVEVVQYTMTG